MKFYICDDNRAIQKLYGDKLLSLCQKNRIPCEVIFYNSGKELLFDFETQNGFPGIILLDIRMPGDPGTVVAKKLREMGVLGEIIFLTISKDHFLDAFDVNAFHYIVKGDFPDERIERIIVNAVAAVEAKSSEYMLFVSGGEQRSVPLKSIQYFEVFKRIIVVHYDDQTFQFFSSLGKIEQQLFGQGFVRTHRAYLVSCTYIESLSAKSITLRDGTKLPVGGKYYNDTKRALSHFQGSFS